MGIEVFVGGYLSLARQPLSLPTNKQLEHSPYGNLKVSFTWNIIIVWSIKSFVMISLFGSSTNVQFCKLYI